MLIASAAEVWAPVPAEKTSAGAAAGGGSAIAVQLGAACSAPERLGDPVPTELSFWVRRAGAELVAAFSAGTAVESANLGGKVDTGSEPAAAWTAPPVLEEDG